MSTTPTPPPEPQPQVTVAHNQPPVYVMQQAPETVGAKSKRMAGSRRFWMLAVAAGVNYFLPSLREAGIELTPDQVNNITLAFVAWILGDSMRKT